MLRPTANRSVARQEDIQSRLQNPALFLMHGSHKGDKASKSAARQEYRKTHHQNPSGLGRLITESTSISISGVRQACWQAASTPQQVCRPLGIQPDGHNKSQVGSRLIATPILIFWRAAPRQSVWPTRLQRVRKKSKRDDRS